MSAHVHLPESNSCPACEERPARTVLHGRYYGRVKLRDGELPPGAGYGPHLVDIWEHHHEPRWRNGRWQDIVPSYSVTIDGEHRTGGPLSHLADHLAGHLAALDLVERPAAWVLVYESGELHGPFVPGSEDLAARRQLLADAGADPIVYNATRTDALASLRLAGELAERAADEALYQRIADTVADYRPVGLLSEEEFEQAYGTADTPIARYAAEQDEAYWDRREHAAVDHQYQLDNEDAATACGLEGCELPRDHRGSCDDGVWRGVQVSVPAWVVEELKAGRGLALDWVRGAVLRAIDGRS
jgi:hypothetical protein